MTATPAVKLAIVAFVAFVALAAAAIGAGALALTHWEWEEWYCKSDEAPAIGKGATRASQCFKTGEELPEGWRWDPKGNRPIE